MTVEVHVWSRYYEDLHLSTDGSGDVQLKTPHSQILMTSSPRREAVHLKLESLSYGFGLIYQSCNRQPAPQKEQ